MQPARFRQEDILLVEINNAKSMSPAVSSGRSVGSFPEQRLVIEPRFLSSTTKFVPAGLGRAHMPPFVFDQFELMLLFIPARLS